MPRKQNDGQSSACAAAVVARRFALAAASTSAQTTLIWVTTAFAAYAAASTCSVVAAPSWLLDFPQGAPSMPGLQVAFVALALSASDHCRIDARWYPTRRASG